MDDFKKPYSIPQDLLLIQEFIGDSLQASQQTQNEDISSSSESGTDAIASEDEIERELISKTTDDLEPSDTVPASPSSGSEGSDSEGESTSDSEPPVKAAIANEQSDDDGEGALTQSRNNMLLKNEIVDVPINIPDTEEVGREEAIEKVGDIMSIVGNVAIVKGLSSGIVNRGSDKALDSDTLLVFDDRRVLGYIYETFGPTSQPLYQVRFNDAFPLDLEKVRVSREVFHVPRRSKYVFLREITRIKGSDASNVNDEEPAEDEVEFSDDEAEAAYRLHMKRKRSASRASSQQPPSSLPQPYEEAETPTYSGTAFDAHSPYDANYGIAPPRPLPMPYEDPYSGEYSGISPEMEKPAVAGDTRSGEATFLKYNAGRVRERGRGAGRHQRAQSRGRGKGRGRGGRPSHEVAWSPQPAFTNEGSVEPYSPHDPRLITPDTFQHLVSGQSGSGVPYTSWQGFSQAQPFSPGSQAYQSQPVVQPHINPRFASAFGLHLNPSPYTQMPQQSQPHQAAWTDDWALRTGHPAAFDQNSNTNNETS